VFETPQSSQYRFEAHSGNDSQSGIGQHRKNFLEVPSFQLFTPASILEGEMPI
jgi:hypothetical protein